MESKELRLAKLVAHVPDLEARAKHLQAKEGESDESAIEALRSDYLRWYAQGLTMLSPELATKFKDLYEGGMFVHRIKHFLEAPTERNSLLETDLAAKPNPLIPYWSNPFATTFRPSILGQREVLSLAMEVEKSDVGPAAAVQVEAMCRRFPLVLEELKRRRSDRQALVIKDEYDLQDLFRALLVAMFDDVRPEEWTPSYAGGSSKMDFLLKREEVVIETKITRQGDGPRRIRDELALDILNYQVHPKCRILVCFVYDPERRITNPRGFEQDLTGPQGELLLRVAVVQG
jgi:hypothetical protein